jgi:hypothetical protein
MKMKNQGHFEKKIDISEDEMWLVYPSKLYERFEFSLTSADSTKIEKFRKNCRNIFGKTDTSWQPDIPKRTQTFTIFFKSDEIEQISSVCKEMAEEIGIELNIREGKNDSLVYYLLLILQPIYTFHRVVKFYLARIFRK